MNRSLKRSAPPADTPTGRSTPLERVLAAGPRSAEELISALGISQPTLSRTIQDAGGRVISFRIPGIRTPRYALTRSIPKTASQQPVFRVSPSGQIAPAGTLSFLAGGGTLASDANGKVELFDGLPPALAFASPSGFLGRQIAGAVSKDLEVPGNIRDWSDDHRIAYLANTAPSVPGDLILGDRSLELEVAWRQNPRVIPARARSKAFPELASNMVANVAGSSAGGEQPKFLTTVDDAGQAGHVIVKFARRGTRAAELLALEDLALRCLLECGHAAAGSQLRRFGEIVFLEVQRFDRVGLLGREGAISAGALDDELFGARDNWSGFAARCVDRKLLSSAQAQEIRTMAAYGELIGNADMHFENLSLLLDGTGKPRAVAPAYDMLPMRYAAIGGGMEPNLTPIQPKLAGVGTDAGVWSEALKAAELFWSRAAKLPASAGISDGMRALAVVNLAAATAFVRTFMPDAPKASAPPHPRLT